MHSSLNMSPVVIDIASQEELRRQARLFDVEVLHELLNATIEGLLVLNKLRQVVYANYKMLEMAGQREQSGLLGKRPGDVLSCSFAMSSPEGCGSTDACKQCGALHAVVLGLQGLQTVDECRIIHGTGDTDIEALDLRVRATPIQVSGERFVILAFQDIRHEKRRRVLERIFFHDILNTAGGLRGFVEMLHTEVPEHLQKDTHLLQHFLGILLDEINTHKILLAAETGELTTDFSMLYSREFLVMLRDFYESHDVARDKSIEIVNSGDQSLQFESDLTLLRRVMANLLKNALEATAHGGTVTMGSEPIPFGKGQGVRLWVRNTEVMDQRAQRDIFNRTFSTKGEGRGVGTYSVKLITERYLHGKASFISSNASGTLFMIDLPESPSVSEDEGGLH